MRHNSRSIADEKKKKTSLRMNWFDWFDWFDWTGSTVWMMAAFQCVTGAILSVCHPSIHRLFDCENRSDSCGDEDALFLSILFALAFVDLILLRGHVHYLCPRLTWVSCDDTRHTTHDTRHTRPFQPVLTYVHYHSLALSHVSNSM